MTNKTITGLTAASALDGSELLPLTQGGNSRKQTLSGIKSFSQKGSLAVPSLNTSGIVLVAGTIKQRAADRTKWDFIDDPSHVPVGVSGSYATASGATITVNFDTTYSRVIGCSVGPDETLANAHNMTVGGSCGLSSLQIKCGVSIAGESLLRWNGSAWVQAVGTGQQLNFSAAFEDNAYGQDSVRISHDYCPGIGLDVAMWQNAGSVPYCPMIQSISNTDCVLTFVDLSSPSAPVNSGSESTKMAFKISKRYSEGILLDGTGDSDDLALDAGNIWFEALMEI